ncbi:methylamine utilization protein MauE [Motilibacter rhizosphaerae]|uniref:Methylamine utilization protein MauE n=1 Tax=Motilibacter rhizosphaerae TaxID=598652 RepID=A0A4Q7NGF8_9ACTN|nr:MauE/DoxX family redox-associated membrane protein [Motilibacter rhizosphaerae]RZS82874.1 methylamine utilization protein MauE [Motilibacter rhizosphaerae]
MSTARATLAAPPGTPQRGRVLDTVGTLLRVVLGVVLVVAALLKLPHPGESVRAVQAYQILPHAAGVQVGHVLPFVELAIGVLLVLGLATRGAAVVAGLLMVAFLVGISSAWARGLSIDCGCFGGGGAVAKGHTRYVQELLRDAGLLACAAWLVVRPRTLGALESLLLPDMHDPQDHRPAG